VVERIRQMLKKEFIQVFRDPRMWGVVFVAPLLQLIILGYAATIDVLDIPTAVLDRDRSAASRELTARFERSGYFRVVEHVDSDARAEELLDAGTVGVVLQMDPGFEADILSGRPAPLGVFLDGTDSMTASVVMSYSASVASRYARDVLAERLARLPGRREEAAPVTLETRAWFNENLESRNYFIPGVIGLIVSLVTLLLTSMAVVREKEIGTIEQIMVTPIRPFEFILGKTLPFALIGFVDVALVLVMGVLWFDVPLRGSVPLLFLCMALYVLTSLGVGLLISTISRTQQQALMSTFFFFMPAMLLSGFAFPIENMPDAVQALTYLNPLRYLFVILRGIFLKGVGMSVLWPQILALGAFGAVALALASLRFRKTIE